MRNAERYFWRFLDFLLAWITAGVDWFRTMLADAGLPGPAGTAVVVATAILLAVVILRLFRGILRLLLIILIALLIARSLGVIG